MITRKDIEHIARLARIRLRAGDLAVSLQELGAILAFVAKLNEAETSSVEPLTGGTELANVMREDQAALSRSAQAGPLLIDAAPQTRGGYVEVKAVFERE